MKLGFKTRVFVFMYLHSLCVLSTKLSTKSTKPLSTKLSALCVLHDFLDIGIILCELWYLHNTYE